MGLKKDNYNEVFIIITIHIKIWKHFAWERYLKGWNEKRTMFKVWNTMNWSLTLHTSRRFILQFFCTNLSDTEIICGILLPLLDNGLHSAILFCYCWCFKAPWALHVCSFSQPCLRLLVYHCSLIPGIWVLSLFLSRRKLQRWWLHC